MSLQKNNEQSSSVQIGRYGLLTTDYELAEIEFQNALLYYQKSKDQIGVARVYGLQSILAERLDESDKSKQLVLKRTIFMWSSEMKVDSQVRFKI